jgi:hypothetical protein
VTIFSDLFATFFLTDGVSGRELVLATAPSRTTTELAALEFFLSAGAGGAAVSKPLVERIFGDAVGGVETTRALESWVVGGFVPAAFLFGVTTAARDGDGAFGGTRAP